MAEPRSPEITRALEEVLVEILTHLGRYAEHMVVVGGMGTYLLIRDHVGPEGYIGTRDIDLLVNPSEIPGTVYARISEILSDHGFQQKKDLLGKPIPSIFVRTKLLPGEGVWDEEIDFLAPEYGGSGRKRRHQRVQDLLARKVRGGDLALEGAMTVPVRGVLPSGAPQTRSIRVASPASLLVMKAVTFGDRKEDKDAYDIVMLLRHAPGGLDSAVEYFTVHGSHGLVREAVRVLEEAFGGSDSIGPAGAASSMGATGPEVRAQDRQLAFEVVQRFLKRIWRGGGAP
ncbi:MAG: nucleotidyl transferase AbiEii/AbiGii toxin family protein [Nitrospirae bacterium]|nr:nucleotidyl transferase AbiEii/AbiGii toxin family protein [Nitrospirota bacterium]